MSTFATEDRDDLVLMLRDQLRIQQDEILKLQEQVEKYRRLYLDALGEHGK